MKRMELHTSKAGSLLSSRACVKKVQPLMENLLHSSQTLTSLLVNNMRGVLVYLLVCFLLVLAYFLINKNATVFYRTVENLATRHLSLSKKNFT